MANETIDIEEVKAKVSKGLEKARWSLLNEFPFIGEMLLRFSIIPTYDGRINTACTDGKKIYFDCEFYSKINEKQREFVLAHEVWHNILLHFTRREFRNGELWNVATDMEINHMLQNEGMEILEDVCLPPPEVAGKNAEDIYAFLNKQENKQKQKQKNNNKDDKDDSSNGGSSGNNDQGQDDGNDDGQKNPNGSGNNKTKYGNQFDKHFYEGDSAGEQDEGGKSGKWGEKGEDKDFNPKMEDAKEVEDRIHDAVCAVAQSIERKQGHLPAGIDQLVKEMLKPEVNWKERLAQFTTQCFGGEHHWRRCSRHALGRGMYLPGRNEEKIKVACAVDTSGSYLRDLPKFLGELNSLLNSFGNYEITLIQCDAEVQDVKTYSPETPLDVKDFKAKGGGGTDFRPVFKWVRENGEDEFNCLIYFTDGYGTAPTYAPPYPTLWVLTSDGTEEFCEWGQKMRFKADNN